MSFQTTYHADKAFFETVIEDRVDAESIIALDQSILDSPDWQGGKPRLVVVKANANLSAIDLAVLTERILPHVQTAHSRRARKERIAWVVPSDLSRAIISVWELMPEKDALQDFKTFSTREEALDWLLASPETGS